MGLGDRGFNAFEYIHAREFGIIDAEHDPKKGKHPVYCKGGAASDFRIGEVDWIYTSDIAQEVVGVIDKRAEIERQWNADGSSTVLTPPDEQTKVVFVFFDQNNDVKWLRENGIVLDQYYPKSEFIDIQLAEVGRTISRQLGHTCGAADLFAYMGGNDAAFELQALIASMCLTVDQKERLRQGESMKPMLPAIWEAGFDWATGKIGVAGDYVGTESTDCLKSAQVNGVEAPVDNSDDVHDSRGADHIHTVVARDARCLSIFPIVHAASARTCSITLNTPAASSLNEAASISRPQTSAAMWAAFRR